VDQGAAMVVAEALTNKEQLKKIDLNGKQSHFQTIAEKKVRRLKKRIKKQIGSNTLSKLTLGFT